jgi:hypothetical protein
MPGKLENLRLPPDLNPGLLKRPGIEILNGKTGNTKPP